MGRWLLVVLLFAPFLVWMGATLAVKWTLAGEVPFTQLAPMVGHAMVGPLICSVTGCEADLPDGMQFSWFTRDLVEDTIVALDIDERGRVFVVESGRQRAGAEDNRNHPYWLMDDLASRTVEDRQAYYEKALAEGRFEDPDHFTRFSDRVVLLEDTDGDEVADRRVVLAEWNEMVTGIIAGVEAREGTLWVTDVPSIFRLRDEDGDDRPEVVDELHRGFGVKTSLGGHDLHGLVFGPDGKLYFSMGDRGYHVTLPDGRVLAPDLGPGRGAVFRMNPDGSGLEVFATGVRNPQELAFDDYGNLFTGDNNGDGGDQARLVYVVEGGETGWAMPYQTLADDYVRGPWVAERLWEVDHPTRPAWALPPVAYIGNGPSGLAHYPGLGLPARYADHFFLCDYGYTNGRSGVWSFAVEPKGASFEMVDKHHFAWSMLATDFDFSWDGRMFATIFDQMAMGQDVAMMRHPESLEDPRVSELSDHVAQPMREKDTSTLVELLAFPDQRLRIRAQDELAGRREIEAFVALARDAQRDPIARLHALWGLGQIGVDGLRALAPNDLAWAAEADDEYRAQLMKVAGTAGADWLRGSLEEAIDDAAPRVRFFAAQSLGAIGNPASVDRLFELIRENADEDVYLRHAAVHALARIGDLDAVVSRASDADRSVRLAVLLVLRRVQDPRIAAFVDDVDPLIAVEAARAIYDVPIDAAMASLAALAPSLTPAAEDDTQTAQALHRRVIGANVRLRSEAGAAALARYAADEAQWKPLRALALESLASYAEPPPRDLTMGFHRPLDAVPAELVARVFRLHGRALVDSSIGARALEIASELGEMPLDDEELLEIVRSPSEPPGARASALRALESRTDSEGAAEALGVALADPAPEVRIAARELLYRLDPEAALVEWIAVTDSDRSLAERKRAWRRLGSIDDPRAAARLASGVDAWQIGALDPAVALEVLEAAAAQSDARLATRARGLLAPGFESAVEQRRWALAGGDPEAGRRIFQTHGDCQRCHGGEAGHDAGVGPELAGVARRGADYVLESILDPQAQIAEGFATVVVTRLDGSVDAGLLVGEDADTIVLAAGGTADGDRLEIPRREIESISEPTTGMPPIGLGLEPAPLRDLVAYVMSLD